MENKSKEPNLFQTDRINRKFLILVFIIISALILVIGFYVNKYYRNNILDNIRNELRTVSELKAEELIHWRNERIRNLSIYQMNESFGERVKTTLNNSNNPEILKAMTNWMMLFKDNYNYHRICIHDTSGKEILSTSANDASLPHDIRTYYGRLFKDREIIFEDFYIEPSDNRLYLSLLVGMMNVKNNNQPLGVLIARVDPEEYIFPHLSSWPVSRKSSEILLVTKKENEAVVFNNYRNVKNSDLIVKYDINKFDSIPEVKAVSGLSGLYENKDFNGKDVIAYIKPVKNTPWYLVAKIEKNEIHATADKILFAVISFSLLIIFAVGISMVLLFRFQKYNYYKEIAKKSKALAESERFLNSLISNLKGIIYRRKNDEYMTMTFVNTESIELTGCEPEEFYEGGKTHYSDLILKDDMQKVRNSVEEAIKQKTHFVIEYRIKDAKGNIKWVLEKGEGIFALDGELQFLEGFITDISDIKSAEQKLKLTLEELNKSKIVQFDLIENLKALIAEKEKTHLEITELNETLEQKVKDRTKELELSNKELEAFSYSVSHDLRAPLRHILGFADIIKKQYSGKNEQSGYINNIVESAGEMGNLIDNLLNYSRTGRSEIKKNKVDLNETVKQIQTAYIRENQEKNISWKISKLPEVECDEELIRTVWVNLIDNAIKYTSKKDISEIEIGYSDTVDKNYEFYIKDNGAGFDMEYSHKLFGVFQRLHNRKEFEGTGIGLANVMRIISRHGGNIRAEGEVDKGATFYFTLPKIKE